MFREKIKVVDCTIRDGGLINNHKFDHRFVREVYKSLSEAGVDYMEIGYKNSKRLFSPKYGWVSFFLWSHKVLRWFTPIFLFLLMLITIPLAQQSSTFSALLYIQVAFYFLACLGWLAEKVNIKFLPLRMCLYFVSINYGFVLGMIRFLKGQQNAIWDKITDK